MTDSTEDKKPTRAELLEEEGDIAADYLEAVSYTHLTLPTTPYV